MKKLLLSILKKSKIVCYVFAFRNVKAHYSNMPLLHFLMNTHIYVPKGKNRQISFSKQFRKMAMKMNIFEGERFVYPYDPLTVRVLPFGCQRIVSVTPDYTKVIDSRVSSMQEKVCQLSQSAFREAELTTIESVKIIARRCNLLELIDKKPDSLEEAIQKYLFFNALFWQSNHWHNGCGRLDLDLYPYYKKDIEVGALTRETAKTLLVEMVRMLGKDTYVKSFSLIGDTGQYILLGGIDKNGSTVQNELTELFLEILSELKIPDPKIILRVNKNTSDAIWHKALSCIATGCGSPLIINEDIVMNGMMEFGYAKEDVWNMGTSACWEPLIIGKSFDQNNPMANIPIVDSLNKLLALRTDFEDFDEFLNSLKLLMAKQIEDAVIDIKFDVSPLFSLFFGDCIEREQDFTFGGAKYTWHGIQIVSLPNLVNALLNIKRYVYKEKLLTLKKCQQAISNNYTGYEDVRWLMKANSIKYGQNSEEVVELTNDLQIFMSEVAKKLTINGNKIKIGFSSSQYIARSKEIGATLDGRKDGAPFAVHISPVSHQIDFQEVVEFAGQLDYGDNRMNGNVVDFILPHSYLRNTDKLIAILKDAVNKGVYELQLNVLDVETLRDAKVHPEKYPSLIVRVWGFSAYFNDLPEEYKDNLIARAEINEAS